MGRTPRELARAVTASEFAELCAFARIEPFGFEIENFRSAIIAHTTARVAGSKTSKLSNYYPTVKHPIRVDEQTRDQQIALIMAAAPPEKG